MCFLVISLVTLCLLTTTYNYSSARSLKTYNPQAKFQGSTAHVTIKNNIVTKKITSHTEGDVFNREVYWLKTLKSCSFIPKLLSINKENQTITMTYVGRPLTKRNLPKNWQAQIEHIITNLEQHHCYHNDINKKNILVDNKKIYLIDFGIATNIHEDCRTLYPHLLRFQNPSTPHISNKDALYKTIYKILREPFLITH